MTSRSASIGRKLVKYGDIMPQPVTFAGPSTWRGFGLSLTILSLAIALGILFTYQYFTERIIIPDKIPTQHVPTHFRMRCVSHSGCNVSYVFTPGTICAQRVPITQGPTFHLENATFLVTLCFDENLLEDGVVITSIFRLTDQYNIRKKTWIAEIAQPDRPGLPLASMHDLQLRISLLHSESTIKHLWRKRTLLSFRWSLGKTENDYSASSCPTAFALPPGVTCAGYLLKPSRDFEQNVIQLRNSAAAVIAVWVSLLLAAVNIAKVFSSVKLKPEQLNVVVEPLNENGYEGEEGMYTLDTGATGMEDTQFGVELETSHVSDKDA